MPVPWTFSLGSIPGHRPLVSPCAHVVQAEPALYSLDFITNITSLRPQLPSSSFPTASKINSGRSIHCSTRVCALSPKNLGLVTGKFIPVQTRTEPEYGQHPSPMCGLWNPVHLVPQSPMNHPGLHGTKSRVLKDPPPHAIWAMQTQQSEHFLICLSCSLLSQTAPLTLSRALPRDCPHHVPGLWVPPCSAPYLGRQCKWP